MALGHDDNPVKELKTYDFVGWYITAGVIPLTFTTYSSMALGHENPL